MRRARVCCGSPQAARDASAATAPITLEPPMVLSTIQYNAYKNEPKSEEHKAAEAVAEARRIEEVEVCIICAFGSAE